MQADGSLKIHHFLTFYHACSGATSKELTSELVGSTLFQVGAIASCRHALSWPVIAKINQSIMRSSLLLSAPVRLRLWRGCQVPDVGHALALEHGLGHCIPALQAGSAYFSQSGSKN